MIVHCIQCNGIHGLAISVPDLSLLWYPLLIAVQL